jgi:molecular chaperone DnaK (HSP70)
MSKSDINEIILLGGSTSIPKIISLIQEFFNGKKPHKFINNKESFANGASILGAVVTNVKNDYIEQLIVLNVNPLSLGIEGENGEMECIIPRNYTIPTKKTGFFSTFKNNVVKVYEGENKLAKDNNLLNEFKLDEIDPMIKNRQMIEILFILDVNLVLDVFVKKSNGKYNKYLIENKIKLSQNEIDKSREKIEKLYFEKNKENEKELENRNEIIVLEKEIERLKEENRILKDKNEKNIKIIEDEKITNNNYKNKIKILNDKLDDLIQKLNNIHQEQSKLKSELNELNIKYENNKNIIEEKIKIKNQEFNEINKDLSKLMEQKRNLEDEYN